MGAPRRTAPQLAEADLADRATLRELLRAAPDGRTAGEIREATGWGQSRMVRVIRQLREYGQIECVGAKSAARWYAAGRAPGGEPAADVVAVTCAPVAVEPPAPAAAPEIEARLAWQKLLRALEQAGPAGLTRDAMAQALDGQLKTADGALAQLKARGRASRQPADPPGLYRAVPAAPRLDPAPAGPTAAPEQRAPAVETVLNWAAFQAGWDPETCADDLNDEQMLAAMEMIERAYDAGLIDRAGAIAWLVRTGMAAAEAAEHLDAK